MSTGVSTALVDRRRRIAAARHRRRRTVLLACVAGSAAMAGAWWIATGPLLTVTEVNVAGYRQADQARVVRIVQAAAAGGDMLRLPTVRIREALASTPWVEDVAVHHNWPRGIDVRIRQATPAAIAIDGTGARFVVSSRGRVLGLQTVAADLPEIGLASVRAGEWLTGPARRGPVVLATALATDVRGRVRDIRLSQGVVTATLDGGTVLRFGPPVDLWRKGRSLDAVLASAAAADDVRAATYIDFTNPERPVFGGLQRGSDQASTETQASDPVAEEPSTNN